MFRKLLRLARDHSTIEMGALARELGVSIDTVQQLVQVLEELGYIERTVLGCNQPCEPCSLEPTCLSRDHLRLWHVTSKGEKCLAQIDDPA
jgi:hypothetical protein